MFSSVRRYRLMSGSFDELLHLVDTDFAETVQEMDGFVEYQVLECGNGELVTITTFRDRRSAEESAAIAADWIRDTLARRFDASSGSKRSSARSRSAARPHAVLVPARY